MSPYFITGYQRSRTAWLSAWLSSGASLCLHEGLSRHGSISELGNTLSRLGSVYDAVGDSDPTLPLFAPEVNALFPEARLVVIERKREDCRDSLVHQGLSRADAEAVLHSADVGISYLVQAPRKVLRVRYDELDERLPDVWDFCVGGGYDSLRTAMLREMNIQRPIGDLEIHPRIRTEIVSRVREVASWH